MFIDLAREHRRFVLFIGILSLFRLIYINFFILTPQEAYYWYYSLKPALSYFDHPPAAAYSIWLGISLFGNSIFGIKVTAVIWSLLTNLLLYTAVIRINDHRTFFEKKQLAFSAAG